MVDAKASVNGVAVPETDGGGAASEWLVPLDDPCVPAAWGLNFDRVPSWLISTTASIAP